MKKSHRCECGCNGTPKTNNRFIHGHQWVINSKFIKMKRKQNDGRFIFSKEWNKQHNKNKVGENAYHYKGGKGRHGIECKQARIKLIEEKGKCEISNMSNEEHKQLFKGKGLVVHHIDNNVDNNKVNNLIILRTDLHSEIRNKILITRKEIFNYFNIEFISWNEFEDATYELYNKVKNINFDNIYGIPRGGIILATILSNKLEKPLILNKKDITQNTLICEDIVDSGNTIINNNFDKNFVISIHYKKNNLFKPNFYIYEKRKRFILYPWEPNNKNPKLDGTRI